MKLVFYLLRVFSSEVWILFAKLNHFLILYSWTRHLAGFLFQLFSLVSTSSCYSLSLPSNQLLNVLTIPWCSFFNFQEGEGVEEEDTMALYHLHFILLRICSLRGQPPQQRIQSMNLTTWSFQDVFIWEVKGFARLLSSLDAG